MLKHSKNLVCLAVAASLMAGSVPAMASSVPTLNPGASVLLDRQVDLAPATQQLDELARGPVLTDSEAQETEGGLPLAIVLALAGSASAMGFYLYGVLVQKKPFSAKEFAKRGGCGALVGVLGRFIAGRSAAIRIFGSGATGAALAACFR